jgi:histidinol phosphatase-like enzyme (inositol monophosphatase family)
MAPPPQAEFLAFAHELADAAAAAILPHFRTRLAVRNKAAGGAFDPVTAADRAAERVMRSRVAARYPEHGISGEEFGDTDTACRYRWVIDPIDGTRAFITGSPLWGTLIGLTDAGQPLLGLMHQPFTGERFWSERGRLLWRGPGLGQRAFRTRGCARLAEAVLTSTHPDLFAGAQATAFAAVRSRVRMVRYGGDCYGYCLLAAGFVDLVIECGLKPHDVIALIPIIQSAGGVITGWDGQSAAAGGCVIAAGDRRVHREAMALLRAGG